MTEAYWLLADAETGGVDVFNDRIIQFVVATADPQGNILAHREWVLNPGVEISQGSIDVHGFTNEYLAENGQDAREALTEIVEMIETYPGLIFSAYNAAFDLSILDAELKRYGVRQDFGTRIQEQRIFDALVVDRAKDKYRKGPRKLLNVAKHYGIPLDETKLHDALYDVEITAKVAAAVEKRYGIPSNNEQAAYYRAWAEGLEAYLRREDPDAKVDRDWPLKLKEEA